MASLTAPVWARIERNRRAATALIVQSIATMRITERGSHGTKIRSQSQAIMARVQRCRACRSLVDGARPVLRRGERSGSQLRAFAAMFVFFRRCGARAKRAGADQSRR